MVEPLRLPVSFALNAPVELTVARLESSLDHCTVTPLTGSPLRSNSSAVSVRVSLILKDTDVGETLSDRGSASTVISALPVILSIWALMVAVPLRFAVINNVGRDAHGRTLGGYLNRFNRRGDRDLRLGLLATALHSDRRAALS